MCHRRNSDSIWLVVSNICLFSIIYGIILPIWLSYFSRWLKPPTSNHTLVLPPSCYRCVHVVCKLLNALYSLYYTKYTHVLYILIICIYIYIHVFKFEWGVSTHNYLHIERLESQVNCSYEKWPAFLVTSYYGVLQQVTTHSGNHYGETSACQHGRS